MYCKVYGAEHAETLNVTERVRNCRKDMTESEAENCDERFAGKVPNRPLLSCVLRHSLDAGAFMVAVLIAMKVFFSGLPLPSSTIAFEGVHTCMRGHVGTRISRS